MVYPGGWVDVGRPRGHRAGRGGAGAVTRSSRRPSGPRVFALPPGVDFSRALVGGARRAAGGPAAGGDGAGRDLGEHPAGRSGRWPRRFAAGPARLLPRIRVVTELADDPLGPLELPPPVPALRRRLELARLVRAPRRGGAGARGRHRGLRSRRQPRRAARRDAGRGDRAGRLRRASMPASTPSTGSAACASSTLIAGYRGSRAARRAQGADARRRRGAGRGLGDRAARASGDRRRLDRLARRRRAPSWRRWRGCRRGRWCCRASTPACRAAVWERLGAEDAGAADHPQHGLPPARRRARLRPARRCPPGTRRRRRRRRATRSSSLALRPAPVTDQWRERGRGARRQPRRRPAPG